MTKQAQNQNRDRGAFQRLVRVRSKPLWESLREVAGRIVKHCTFQCQGGEIQIKYNYKYN